MDMKEMMKKKKEEGSIDPSYKKAKMGVLKEIRDMASKDAADGIGSVKKVTVAAPDKESLEEGLEKAKAMLHQHDEEAEDPKEEASETPEEEAAEDSEEKDEGDEDLTPEECDEMIAVLQKKKEELLKEKK